MSAPQQRDQVSRLAKHNPDAALVIARKISEPWFQAQALSHVARHTKNNPLAIAQEARVAAQSCDDAYKSIAVRAWEIAALAERQETKAACTAFVTAVKQSDTITPMSSRSEALILLLQSAIHIGTQEMSRAAKALITVANSDSHWRCQRAVKNAVAIIAKADADSARKLAITITDEKVRTACEQSIRAGGMDARPFFW